MAIPISMDDAIALLWMGPLEAIHRENKTSLSVNKSVVASHMPSFAIKWNVQALQPCAAQSLSFFSVRFWSSAQRFQVSTSHARIHERPPSTMQGTLSLQNHPILSLGRWTGSCLTSPSDRWGIRYCHRRTSVHLYHPSASVVGRTMESAVRWNRRERKQAAYFRSLHFRTRYRPLIGCLWLTAGPNYPASRNKTGLCSRPKGKRFGIGVCEHH